MTPYGYRISDGKAVIEPEQAEQIRTFFRLYLAGASIRSAAERAGLPVSRSAAGHMLAAPVYLGDDFYPPLIDPDTFHSAAAERERRYSAQGRFSHKEPLPPVPVRDRFRMLPEGDGSVPARSSPEGCPPATDGSAPARSSPEGCLPATDGSASARSSPEGCLPAGASSFADQAAWLYSRICYSPSGDRQLRMSDLRKMQSYKCDKRKAQNHK